MKAIYIDSNGVVKYNPEWPERPQGWPCEGDVPFHCASTHFKNCNCQNIWAPYDKALSKAKQESVPFADQEQIKKITSDLFPYYSCCPRLHRFDKTCLVTGNFASLPGIEVEIKKITEYKPVLDDCGMIPQAYWAELAYIKSPLPVQPVESQEELWRSALKITRKGSLEDQLQELKKHFTITRK